jgi:hypothetical protein
MRRVQHTARRCPLALDQQQPIVFRDAIGPAQRARLDLVAAVHTARSAMVVSSVSPERCEITEA